MAGKKRASEDGATTGRAAKAAKTNNASSPGSKGNKKGGPKATLSTSAFKSRALPLHVNLTHTPPSIPDENSVPAASKDPGFIGTTTLVASSFSTGSYGWKGSKRIVVELPDPEGGEGKEKVHVMLTINATVMGSKQMKEDEKENGETVEEDQAEDAPEENDAE